MARPIVPAPSTAMSMVMSGEGEGKCGAGAPAAVCIRQSSSAARQCSAHDDIMCRIHWAAAAPFFFVEP